MKLKMLDWREASTLAPRAVALAFGVLVAVSASDRAAHAQLFNQFPIATPNSVPQGIPLGPDGALWFTEALGNKIGRITTAGVITEYTIPVASSSPQGITTMNGAQVTSVGNIGYVSPLWTIQSAGAE
jgi:streptogramin lyase